MTAPKCMECGSSIRKQTISKIWWLHDADLPRTIEDARSRSNLQMVSHRWAPLPNDGGRYIHAASYWDGESYVSPYFCSGSCAQKFGIACAASLKERQRNDE